MSNKDRLDSVAQKEKAETLLQGAYALQTADDNSRYYRDFAPIYDSQFAERLGYCYPQAIADVYQAHGGKADQPIADIGCGTGLVAAQLQKSCKAAGLSIDGIDISDEMLQAARAKSLYRVLLKVDLTDANWPLTKQYNCLVSAGTFTHGHLGPDVLERLLDIALPGALFCIGVNTQHYAKLGFAEHLQSMRQQGLISQPIQIVKPIYKHGGQAHSEDTATVLVYRRSHTAL